MTDPRVAKVVQAGVLRLVVSTDAEAYISILEDAGLTVFDAKDDEIVERISDVADQWVDSIAFLSVDDEPSQRNSQLNDFARDILAALAMPREER